MSYLSPRGPCYSMLAYPVKTKRLKEHFHHAAQVVDGIKTDVFRNISHDGLSQSTSQQLLSQLPPPRGPAHVVPHTRLTSDCVNVAQVSLPASLPDHHSHHHHIFTTHTPNDDVVSDASGGDPSCHQCRVIFESRVMIATQASHTASGCSNAGLFHSVTGFFDDLRD